MQKYGNLSPPPSPSPVKGEEIFDFLRDHHLSDNIKLAILKVSFSDGTFHAQLNSQVEKHRERSL
jgi:hypothetical protein